MTPVCGLLFEAKESEQAYNLGCKDGSMSDVDVSRIMRQRGPTPAILSEHYTKHCSMYIPCGACPSRRPCRYKLRGGGVTVSHPGYNVTRG